MELNTITTAISYFFKETTETITTAISNFIEATKHSAFYNSDFVQSNALNFIIVVVFLLLVCKMCNVKQKLTNLQQQITNTINSSVETKENSIKELIKANEKTKNIQNEIAQIETTANENIELLKEKIKKETEVELKNIEKNTKKIIETQNKEVVFDITQKTALTAIEVAKNHIKQVLKQKPQYHQKFIEESINELESGLKIK